MEETDEFIVLINRVKKEKILYNCLLNTGLPLEQLKKLKDEAWEKISNDLKMPVLECKIIWAKLKEDYVKAKRNIKFVKIEDGREKIDADFKYKEQMEFLSNHIDHSSSADEIETSPHEVNVKREVIDRSNVDLKESININENSLEMIDFEEQSNINTDRNIENDCLELSDNDEVDGEIIMQLGDEYITVPAKILNNSANDDDDSFKDDIIVNITPKHDLSNVNSSDSYIPIELEVEGNYEPKVKIPYNEIFDLLNLNEELNLSIDSEAKVKSSKDDKIVLIPKRKYQEMEAEDPTSEEFFYKTLALTASNIENIKDRLELRQKVSNCVMEAVSKYFIEKEKNGNR
ncbi:hypothetical protein O3M35_002486 [Rhynocoris fuscipes]|uniref:MADF domain-containing protein n=1 Tax=Rhynocoris fuscipes TaxID=488301 RepID=A0AAW1CPJ9_9HEMI